MAKKTGLVWTIGHRPFVMGGKVHYVLGCVLPTGRLYSLGKGYKGYLITAPNGTTFVAEKRSGGFVGPSLEAVRKDIKDGDIQVMERQVYAGIDKSKEAEINTPEEFWKKLNCLK